MLMVLMTMAIIIVVGTSMLFVTLSSFSNSIADTQQTRAYNAALTVSGNVQQSMEEIILNKGDLITREGTYLYFTSNENFTGEEEIVDYTMVNGAKVQVKLTNISASDELKDVLVDVIATCRQQTSKVSFTYHYKTRNITLEDTFGNAFVMNSDMNIDTGGEKKRDDLVFRRIEGDISINCWDEILDSAGNPVLEDGNPKKKMTTRYFNPIVLEGITGSIYANGDLIIGAYDNVIKVQGNIYCDGNLTIRGLDLGVNLPALYKKEYKKKFIKYSTIGNTTFAGFEILGTGEYKEYIGKGTVNEAMYLKYTTESGDDDFLPLQIYDEVTHYTLHDLGITKFYTMVYVDKNGNKINDGNGEVLKGADGNPLAIEIGDKPNPNYYGATMYYTQECKPEDMIMQYPQGGNIYCSGDIIFDRVNYGYNWVFAPKGTGDSIQYEYHDLSLYDGTGKGKISLDGTLSENNAAKNKVYNATVGYNKSKIRGDIFCLGRMIIAPENLKFPDSDKTEALIFTKYDAYVSGTDVSNQGIYAYGGANFLSTLISVLGGKTTLSSQSLGTYNRYGATKSEIEKQDYKSSSQIVESIKNSYNSLKAANSPNTKGEAYQELRQIFRDILNGNTTLFDTNNLKGDGYLTGKPTGDGEHNRLRPIEFSKNTNLYIYNWNYKLLLKTQTVESEEFRVTEITRQLNSTSRVQECRTDSTLENTSTSTVNGVPYKAALTVKYQTLDVNKVYVNGNIEAVGVDAFGYDVKAGLKAKKIDKIGEFVSNEYQALSFEDIITYIYGGDEDKAEAAIKDRYFGYTNNANGFYGNIQTYYEVIDNYNRSGGEGTFQAAVYEYDMFVISYEQTRKVKYVYPRIQYWDNLKPGPDWESHQVYEYNHDKSLARSNDNVSYKLGYFYCYGKDGKNVGFYKGNLDNSVTKEKIRQELMSESGLSGAEADRLIADIVDGKLKPSDCAYLEAWQTMDDDIKDYELIGKTEHKHNEVIKKEIVKDGPTQIKAFFVTKNSQNLGKYDELNIYLDYSEYEDIIDDDKLKSLALVSNSAVNSFDAIVQGYNLSVDDMITGDEINYNNGVDKDKIAFPLFGATAAFYDKNQGDDIFYGMYLRASNPRFTNVNKNASVLDVFHEIMSAGFVKIAVLKTESLTEASLREKIKKGDVSVTEYDMVVASDDKDNKDADFDYPLYQLEQSSVVVKKGLNPKTNFFTADNLYTIDGSVGQLGWIDKTIRDVWTYTEGNDWDRYYAIYNNQDGKKDDNVRVMKFYSTKTNAVWSCDNTFGIDPLYCSYDSKGNPVGGNSGGLFTGISNNFRTQVDYTISDNIYLNFGGENGGYDTEREGPVVFGASKDNGVIDSINQLNDTKRMNITIDATKHDVYVYINAPSKYTQPEDGKKGAYVKNSDGTYTMVGEGKGDYDVVAGIEFRKCSWRVKGKHNAYIMLVGDTSINANAYKLEVNENGGIGSDTADRSDTMLGTHFYSGYYTTYSGSYMYNASEHDKDYSLKLAAKEISTVESGNMFIIGTMGNEMTLGRGGYINGFVFLPNGRYVNNSKGFIGILPNAYSSNNQATIVAQDVSIKGSNIGNLVFQAFDVAASAGGSSNDINIDFIKTGEVIEINEWKFGGYYYD